MYLRPLPALYPVSNVKALSQAAPGSVSLNWPSNAAEAAVGAEGYGVLDTNGSQTMRPTASTAKLITALTVLKKYPLKVGQQGPYITLSSSDVDIYNKYLAEDGSVVPVAAGEQISEYQMLQGMMLPSANNMADSLAIWAFGSLAAYKTAATDELNTLGLSSTQIGSDASGFLPDTESTAHDLVVLGEAAFSNAALADIVGQTQATLPVAGTVYNVNSLLGQDGIVGIKTGNSDQAGGVFIFAAKYSLDSSHSVTIVGAVQGTPDLESALNDAIPLLDSAKNNFSLVRIARAGQVVGHYVVPWASSVNAVAAHDVDEVAWASQPPKPLLGMHAIYAPQKAGATVGKLSSSVSTSNNTSVVLQKAISSPPIWWRLVRHKI